MKRKILYLVAVVLLFGGLYPFWRGWSGGTKETTDLKEAPLSELMEAMKIYESVGGQKAADFDLASLDGGRVSLSQYRGKVVLLGFWTTW